MTGDEKQTEKKHWTTFLIDAFSGNRRKHEAASLKRETEKADYVWFCEHFKYLRDSEHESRKDLDQAILTISAALLASSLTFVQFLQVVRRIELLNAGWILLIVALCATLLSMWVGTLLFERAYSQWLEDYEKADAEQSKQGIDFGSILLDALNLISILSLVAGIIVFCIFSCKEMRYKRIAANHQQELSQHDETVPRKEIIKDPGQGNKAGPSGAKAPEKTH